MNAWAVGGAYGISAGLIIYAIESEMVSEEFSGPLIIAWAFAGLVLAIIGTLRRK